jgi:hypothetical protein
VFTVTCTSCRTSYHVQDELVGKTVKCKCGATFRAVVVDSERNRSPGSDASDTIVVCTNAKCGREYRLAKPHTDLAGFHCTVCRSAPAHAPHAENRILVCTNLILRVARNIVGRIPPPIHGDCGVPPASHR